MSFNGAELPEDYKKQILRSLEGNSGLDDFDLLRKDVFDSAMRWALSPCKLTLQNLIDARETLRKAECNK